MQITDFFTPLRWASLRHHDFSAEKTASTTVRHSTIGPLSQALSDYFVAVFLLRFPWRRAIILEQQCGIETHTAYGSRVVGQHSVVLCLSLQSRGVWACDRTPPSGCRRHCATLFYWVALVSRVRAVSVTLIRCRSPLRHSVWIGDSDPGFFLLRARGMIWSPFSWLFEGRVRKIWQSRQIFGRECRPEE